MDDAVRRNAFPMPAVPCEIFITVDNCIGHRFRHRGLDIRQFLQRRIQMGDECCHCHSGKAFIAGNRIKYDLHFIPLPLFMILYILSFLCQLHFFPLCHHILLISAPIIALFFIFFCMISFIFCDFRQYLCSASLIPAGSQRFYEVPTSGKYAGSADPYGSHRHGLRSRKSCDIVP